MTQQKILNTFVLLSFFVESALSAVLLPLLHLHTALVLPNAAAFCVHLRFYVWGG
jgi:hypothetical protein